MALEIVAHGPFPVSPIEVSSYSLRQFEVADSPTEIVDNEEKRLTGQRLHTDFLLEGGHITPSDLGEDGLYYDEYSQNSSYFVVTDESKTAACRCISPVGREGGIGWLPTLKHFTTFPQEGSGAIGYEMDMQSLLPSEVIEVSSLIATSQKETGRKKSEILDATHLLCSTVLRDSLDNGHKLWVMNIQENLRRSLNIFLGTDQVHRIGDPMFYHRPDAIPCAVKPEKAVQSMLLSRSGLSEYRLECLRATMSGVSEQYLSDETIQAFRDVDIPTSPARIGFEKGVNDEHTIGNLATRYTILS